MPTVSRRALVKGAAWTTPVVLATSVVPAYAASATKQCSGVLKFDTHIVNYEGTEGEADQTSYIWFDFGNISVSVPEGRTVKSATVGFWVEKHSGNNDGINHGWPSPTDSRVGYAGKNKSGKLQGNMQTGKGPMNGTFRNTNGNVRYGGNYMSQDYPFSFLGESQQTWEDGTTSTAWGFQTTWAPGDSRKSSYDSTADGCQTFSIPDFGGIQWVAQHIYIPVGRQFQIPIQRFYRIVLDDDTVIQIQEQRDWIGDDGYVKAYS